jgi:putative transposase
MKYINLEKGKYYHIFNRGNNKENIFRCDENYQYYLKLYIKYISPAADTFAYCLMPNHFHLLVRIKEASETETSKVLKTFEVSQRPVWKPFADLFNAYSKAFNKKYNRTGSLFQYKFKRNEVTSLEYMKHLIVYIHRNPLNHGIFENYCYYKYSSYRIITENLQNEIKRDEVISCFDSLENFIYCHETYLDVNDLEPDLKGFKKPLRSY